MPTRKLVSQLRSSCLPDENLYERLVVIGVGDHHLVDVARDGGLVRHWSISVGHRSSLASERIVIGVGRALLVDVHVAGVDPFSDTSESVSLNDVVLLLDLPILIQRSIRKSIEPMLPLTMITDTEEDNLRAVGVLADERGVLAQNLASSITTIQTCL